MPLILYRKRENADNSRQRITFSAIEQLQTRKKSKQLGLRALANPPKPLLGSPNSAIRTNENAER